MVKLNYVGIDVSAKTLEAAHGGPGKGPTVATFDNTPADHRKLIKWATKRGRCARVCLEATGIYSLEVALALHHHPRTEVMVVNPKAIKNYAGACMQRPEDLNVETFGTRGFRLLVRSVPHRIQRIRVLANLSRLRSVPRGFGHWYVRYPRKFGVSVCRQPDRASVQCPEELNVETFSQQH